MMNLLEQHKFDIDKSRKRIWMTDEHIRNLSSQKHIVGLHSYSHPMLINELSYEIQKEEYKKNYDHLEQLCLEGNKITTMAHPCGRYNHDTLEILRNMGIQIGFRSNMAVKNIESLLEIPREDHANVASEVGI